MLCYVCKSYSDCRKWLHPQLEWDPLCAHLSVWLQEPLPASHWGGGDHRYSGQHPGASLLPLCDHLHQEDQEKVWPDPPDIHETAHLHSGLSPQHLWSPLLSSGSPHLLVKKRLRIFRWYPLFIHFMFLVQVDIFTWVFSSLRKLLHLWSLS